MFLELIQFRSCP